MFLHGLDDMPLQDRAAWEELLQQSNALVQGALAADEVNDPDIASVVGFTPVASSHGWPVRLKYQLFCPTQRQSEDYSPGRAIAEQLDPDQLDGRHALDKAQYVWIKTMLEGQILTWGGDRVDMANSMEARPAFLDHHLAAVAVQVPPELRIKGKTEKYVLREAMAGLLPEVLYQREKFAFMAPPAHTEPEKWEQMKGLAADYLSDASIDEAGLLDKEGVKELFERHEDPRHRTLIACRWTL